ncbi:transcriptional regulator GlxA family with amidase domain [Pseudarthrobacter sp. W1I19]|uniref:GlxA family transcriptional regulator n=1 Tax=Pseudarthrobacter sp. W1I19 TaxID=3042288 RepID=UPI0027822F62|nr:GlxA family transcriptional regulator [Pseudarthrobacter sp. W1I19]MDQ0923859.1 transcriptional regulator GlxA family with amidase domain [Pseudarthrobacter sp. W1I19]
MNHPYKDMSKPDRRKTPGSHLVAILVYDGVKLLDVAGPADVFAEANRLGADYRIALLSPTGSAVTTSTGIGLAVEGGVSFMPGPRTLLIPGGDIYPSTALSPGLVSTVAALSPRAQRVASICTGAFILAATGLLDGRRATTHWKVAHKLAARHPKVHVEPDSIYVRDGSIYTSAGVTAGIDLALALVEEDHGADLTREVARALVVYLQRAGGQSQFSAPLQGSPPRTPALRRVVDLVTADPSASHSLADLAGHLNLSPRHLSRLFQDELSTTPARYVESIRCDIAKALLDQGYTATQAAERAGFPSYESLRRVFARELGMTPATYQRRFRTARRAETAQVLIK